MKQELLKQSKEYKWKNTMILIFFMETFAKTGFNAQELLVEEGKIFYGEYIKYKK